MKKYIIINGSPRKNGNSDAIAQTLQKELKISNADVQIFNIRDLNIKNCIACDTCKKNGLCVTKDDATDLIKNAVSADGIIFVSPIYFGNAPGPFKTLVDRFYVLFNPAKNLPLAPKKERKCGIVLTYGGMPNESAVKAADLFIACASVSGYGTHKTLLFGNQNELNSFKKNPERISEIKKLSEWLLK